MNIDQVIAREQIRDLVSRYNANGDSGRFERVRELFCPDATMQIGRGRTYEGLDEIMTIFTGTKENTDRPGGASYVRHFTATHQIEMVDRHAATGRLYFAVLTDVGLDHWGVYMDRYRLHEERWKFASRRVTVDGRSPNSLFPPAD